MGRFFDVRIDAVAKLLYQKYNCADEDSWDAEGEDTRRSWRLDALEILAAADRADASP